MMPPREVLEPAETKTAPKTTTKALRPESKPKAKPLPTLWNVPDPLWQLIEKC